MRSFLHICTPTKARALIFGDERPEEVEEVQQSSPQPQGVSTGKAKYKGKDNSIYDPEYVDNSR